MIKTKLTEKSEPPSVEQIEVQSSNNKVRRFLPKFFSSIARLFSPGKSSIEEELVEFLEEHDPDGVQLNTEERTILSNVLGLSDLNVSEIMVPRTDIIAIDKSSALNEIKKNIVTKEHTRIPVYDGDLDNIVGFIHIKDLIPFFGSVKNFSIHKVIREILFVPPSMKITDLLVRMKSRRVHVAIVLDEYGGTDGLVTMEDLVEEIVGEIEDEHDQEIQHDIMQIGDDLFEVNARASIQELESILGLKLKNEDEEDYETVGGLIFCILGKVPKKGEKIVHNDNVEIEVVDAEPRKIKKLLVKRISLTKDNASAI